MKNKYNTLFISVLYGLHRSETSVYVHYFCWKKEDLKMKE